MTSAPAPRTALAALLAGTALLLAEPAAAAEPTVAVVAEPASGAAPLRVTLRAEGDAVSYSWDLGDGTAAEGPVVEHVYERPGRYVAAVTAASAGGQTSRAEVVVAAYALTLSAPRVAAFGSAAVFQGELRPAVAGARIVLLRDGQGVTHATTGVRGRFRMQVRVAAPGTYAARFGEVASPARQLTVRPVLEARVEGAGVVGTPLRLVTRVRPEAAGELGVRILRNGTQTHRSAHPGAARIGMRSSAPATYRVELRLAPARGYAAVSRALTAAVIRPGLGRGSRGPSVLAVQRRLAELGYVLPAADSHYGLTTYEAVLAFQKVHGLPRSGRVDARVWRELLRARTPAPRHRGTHIEVSKGRQLLYVVRDSRVQAILHVSTGRTGNTPVGTWRIYRKVTGWDWVLWYPLYFLRGFAIHGYPDVPTYPASAGCVRIPMWYAPRLFAQFSHGQLVRVYW
jgi:hypothetical protein